MTPGKKFPFSWFTVLLPLLLCACAEPKKSVNENLRHETFSYRGIEYDLVFLDPRKAELNLFWKDYQGEPYRNFEALKLDLRRTGSELLFATNAGIYSDNYNPGGLHVEKGSPLVQLNLREGEGNFHLLPNGVFYLSEQGAAVMESNAFNQMNPQVKIATQSGPMLVINGELHPSFTPKSDNRHIRSGVGVNSKGEIIFALSRNVVNFYEFARLFRDKLNCANALYLDGTISRFYFPDEGMTDTSGDFVGILAVTRKDPNLQPEKEKEQGSQPAGPGVSQ